MSYVVLLQPRAARDLEAAYLRVAKQAPDTAARWYNGFVESLESLSENPRRCSVAPESPHLPAETRQYLVRSPGGSTYRALFTISGNQVRVLCIRAPGQDLAGRGDV